MANPASEAGPARPNVVLIGAAKAGTTSLYNYLIQHPAVFLPRERKEINYLGGVNQAIGTEAEYIALYRTAGNRPVRMDISTSYIYANNASANIKSLLGSDVRIIAFLRNPIEASHSLWKQMRHFGGERLSFDEALEAEQGRRSDPQMRALLEGWEANYFYTDRFRYVPQLERYYDTFAPENIKIFVYEEFFDDLDSHWCELCRFLRIDPAFRPANFGNIYNPASAGHRFEWLHKLLYKDLYGKKLVTAMMPGKMKVGLRQWLDDMNKKKSRFEAMPDKTRARLHNLFAPDVEKLEKLIGRSLPDLWLR